VCAIHGSKYQLPYLVKSIVSYTSSFMLTVQQLVFAFTEVAAIVFGCATFPSKPHFLAIFGCHHEQLQKYLWCYSPG